MKDLRNLVSLLESKEFVTTGYDSLEQIYKGRTRKRPIKVMNPDPNIDYNGDVLDILGENGKYNFHYMHEKDIEKLTGKIKSVHFGFDINDIYSPLESKRRSGRFSFQYEDLTMPNNKPNYRRILFFYADDTKPKTINNYFAGAKKIDFKDKGFYILSQQNENSNPSGLAFIFDYRSSKYYFANFDDGELEGFAFSFSSSGNSYVFDDAFMFHEGKKVNLYSDTINEIKKAKDNNLTVISWS